jgi:polysaccharide export outer membrane protein
VRLGIPIHVVILPFPYKLGQVWGVMFSERNRAALFLILAGLGVLRSQESNQKTPIAERVPQASYVLGREDQIVIHAFEAEEISNKPMAIGTDGSINIPLAGTIHASGMSVRELESEVSKRLSRYIVHPSVSISVVEYRSQPVSVLGEVNSPGIVRLRGDTTLLEVLSLAGGLKPTAGYSINIVRHVERGLIPLPGSALDSSAKFYVGDAKVKKLLEGRHPEENIEIRADDVITVPRAQLVYVVGQVNRSGGFVLNDHETMSVLQAIANAEGLKASAAAGKSRILRPIAGDPHKKEIPLDISRILRGTAPDLPLQPDDVLFVPANLPKAFALRSVEAAFTIGTGIAIWRP